MEEGAMDEPSFRKFLKRQGKQEHVVDGLVAQVRQFEAYLAAERHAGLDEAGQAEMEAYIASLQAAGPGQARKKVRGVALYYQFTGNEALAGAASAFREQEIAQTRRAFRLKEFRGVSAEHAARLEAAGITDVEQMLDAGGTPQGRQRLAEETGVPPEAILEMVKLADLSRMGALKQVRARLYYDAGVDTQEKLAGWEPEALWQMLAEFVARTGFEGFAPLPKEVRNGVAAARRLPRRVEY
jgi:hypothetical protein